MVDTWTKSHEAESSRLRTWKKKRKSYFEQTVINNPALQDENKPPKQDWQFEDHFQRLEEKTESGNQYHRHINIIRGWVPPELSKSVIPEVTFPLPLRKNQQLTIIEKGAILAAVYECGRKGTVTLSLLECPDDLDELDEFSNFKRSVSFIVLCDAASKLDQSYEGWLKAMLADIEKDLSEEQSAETRQGKKKPWYKKVWAILLATCIAISLVLGVVWTGIQICESETVKSFFAQSKIEEKGLPKQLLLAEKIQSPDNEKILKSNNGQLEKEEKPNEGAYLSPVHESFKTDSSHTLRVSKSMFTITDTNKKIEAQLHMDFNGGSTFISLYIPSSPKTYEICKEMINHYNTILEMQNNSVEVESHLPGERPIEMKDLKFSGRVFIYHEYPIFESKLNDLISFYKNKSLQLQCRGAEYSHHQQKTKQDN